MGDRALQRQHRRQAMRMRRKALDLSRGLEAHVIIAMGDLRLAARIDDIELRGDLIAGPEPRLADERDDRVAIIGGEGGRIGEAEFFERVPDPVVRAGLGEMVAHAGVAAVLLVDHRPEMRVRRLDRFQLGEGSAKGDNAGPIGHRLHPFRHDLPAAFGRGGGAANRVAFIDEHVRDDLAGKGIVSGIQRALDQRPERLEIAAILGQPDAVGPEPPRTVVLHERPPPVLSRPALYSGPEPRPAWRPRGFQ